MRHTAWMVSVLFFCLNLVWGQETSSYVVQQGDSLYSIAKKFGLSIKTLQRANNEVDPRKLKLGQVLTIPTAILPKSVSSSPVDPFRAIPNVPGPQPGKTPVPPPKAVSLITALPPLPVPVRSIQHYVFLESVKDIIDTPKVIPGRWRYIVLHHSATPQGSASAFDVAHRERGMENGLAYHFVIGNGSLTGDGQIEVGRRWLRQIKGGHLKFDSLNEISIGICFVGNFNDGRPTKKQIAAAIELVSYLRDICGPPTPVLMTHTEIHPHHTECPGKYFPGEAFHSLFPGDANQAELARLRSIPHRGE